MTLTQDEALQYIDNIKPLSEETEVNVENEVLPKTIPVNSPITEEEIKEIKGKITRHIKEMKAEKELLEKLDVDAVESYLKKFTFGKFYGEKERVKKRLSISDIVGCIRKSYFHLTKAEMTLGYVYPYQEMVLGVGNGVHDILQKRIPSLDVENDFVLKHYFVDISGRYDLLLNKNVMVEIKTCNTLPTVAEDKHKLQILFYAYILNTFFNFDIKTIQVLYVSRGKFGVKIFDFDITYKIIERVKIYLDTMMAELENSIKNQTPPKKDSKFCLKSDCNFCNFEKVCKKYL